MTPSIPPKLYRYYRFTPDTLAAVKNRTIYFADPLGFNDPFDFPYDKIVAPMTEEELDDALRDYQKQRPDEYAGQIRDRGLSTIRREMQNDATIVTGKRIAELFGDFGICCFTDNYINPLLWSHYADGHKGFCLEFDTRFRPFDMPKSVKYQKDHLPTFSYLKVVNRQIDPQELVDRIMYTKSMDWDYESEWRIAHFNKGTVYTYDHRALTGIFFGYKMPEDHKELLSLVVHGSDTKLAWMQPVPGEYRVEPLGAIYNPWPHAGGGGQKIK